MEGLLPEFQALCENQLESTKRESVVAMDEAFFGDFLILVLIDLRSGYMILESVAATILRRDTQQFQWVRNDSFSSLTGQW